LALAVQELLVLAIMAITRSFRPSRQLAVVRAAALTRKMVPAEALVAVRVVVR
jgi:hypothetical protein